MAERYRRTRGILLHRISSFFRRLFGLRSKEQYLDDEKMESVSASEYDKSDEPQPLNITQENEVVPDSESKEPEIEVESKIEEEVEEKTEAGTSSSESTASSESA